jgi:hypothetical protein
METGPHSSSECTDEDSKSTAVRWSVTSEGSFLIGLMVLNRKLTPIYCLHFQGGSWRWKQPCSTKTTWCHKPEGYICTITKIKTWKCITFYLQTLLVHYITQIQLYCSECGSLYVSTVSDDMSNWSPCCPHLELQTRPWPQSTQMVL